jgi:hypothetical protein
VQPVTILSSPKARTPSLRDDKPISIPNQKDKNDKTKMTRARTEAGWGLRLNGEGSRKARLEETL